MNLSTLLASAKSKVAHAVKVVEPHIADAQSALAPVAGEGGKIGQYAVIGEVGLTALQSLLDEVTALLAAIPDAPAVTPKSAA